MSLPTVTVECAFRTDPDVTSPVWEDISAYAMGLTITRGRQYELDTIEASTLTLRLKNDDRRFDPTYTLSPYYPYVLPMRKIRVSAYPPGNLVSNSGFETNTTGWAVSGVPATFARDTSQHAFGSASLNVSSVGGTVLEGAAAGMATTGLSTGQAVTASFWVRGTGTMEFRLVGASFNPLVTTITLTSTWTRYSMTGAIVDAALTLYLTSGSGATAFNANIDGVQVELGSTASDVLDTDGAAVIPTRYYLFTGYVERWPLSWDAPAWGSVTLTAVDGMAALQNAVVTGTFAQALTGQRITDVLTAASWATSTAASGYWTLDTSTLDTSTRLSYGISTTVIDTGNETVQAVSPVATDEASALSLIQAAASAERGTFFIDGQGRAVFQDRHHRYGATSQVTFADSSFSSSRLPYYDLTPDFDVTRIVNEVKVTRAGGTTQTATDSTSRSKYLRRTLSLTPDLISDTAASDQALFELTLRKDPALRFDSLKVKPAANITLWQYALSLELGQKVTVEHTTGASATITAQTLSRGCFVEAISHTVGADLADWQTSFQLSPSALYDTFFLLDTAVLDAATSAALAY